MTTRDDDALMRRLRRGRGDAFAVLVSRHEKALHAFFRRLGADRHGADECVQETFVRLYRVRRRYREEGRFAAFLFTLARRAWLDWRSHEARWNRVASRPAAWLSRLCEGPRHQLRLELQEGLERLPEGQRMALVLTALHGFRYREAAEILDVPVGTVKSRVHHALRKMRLYWEAPSRHG